MSTQIVNVLLSSFPGLDLPPTLSLPLPADTPISTLHSDLQSRLPLINTRLLLTTSSNKQVLLSSLQPISTLLSSSNDTILPLRLSVPLCGGKGGFGSQLRAAGGRMSSKRKKTTGENNGSNRNLDGRRLRTVTEAKALAEYLALKPEMEKKEKEARRKKWEQVVEMAERREEELKGKKGRVDGQWVEDKEEVAERTREAVRRVMEAGEWKDNFRGEGNGEASGSTGSDEDDSREGGESSKATTPEMEVMREKGKGKETVGRSYFGFDDEDDEFASSSEEEDLDGSDGGVAVDQEEMEVKGKGKSRA